MILGELHLINLITSSVKWVYDTYFIDLLFILHEQCEIVDAR